ncbi:hypothetical protein LTR12_016272 [Friedmanniomyces endolithicus]|nr:hypothetical protein LTR12_016272 [Friedmanniomyces endolithicus]
MKAIHSSKSLLSLLALTSFAYANNALDVNTNTQNNKTVQIAITTWGSDFYYSIMSVMGTTAIGILAASAMKPRSDRVFFYMSAALCFVACIAYFAMGSNLGWTPIDVEWVRGTNGVRGANREIFYARYIDWYKWGNASQWDRIRYHELMLLLGFYTFGCVAMFGVFYQLAVVGRASAKRLGRDVHRVFLICGVLTLFVWLLYPIAWGLCEGGNVISPNDEAVFYGCLDFMAKPVFSIALIIGHWGIKPERLGLKIEDYTDPEKPVPDQENDLQASPRGNLA